MANEATPRTYRIRPSVQRRADAVVRAMRLRGVNPYGDSSATLAAFVEAAIIAEAMKREREMNGGRRFALGDAPRGAPPRAA